MMIETRRHCPACGGSRAELLQELFFAHETGSPLPERYRVCLCGRCGFVFDDVEADAGAFRQYYRTAAKYAMGNIAGAGGISESDRKRYVALLEFLRPFLREEMSVADIGCGKGGQLRILREHGFRNLYGVDASEKCVEFMRSLGMRAICSALEELPAGLRFDLLVVSNIFEHLWDPTAAAMCLERNLNPGGLVCVEVPDASRYRDFAHGVYYYFDMEHINHFDRKSMEQLWNRAGFRAVAARETVSEPVPGFPCPMLNMLLARDASVSPPRYPAKCGDSVKAYIRAMRERELRLGEIAVPQDGECFLWGAGAYAKWLIGNGKLEALRPAGIVDRNPNLQGKLVGCLPVLPPEQLMRHNRRKSTLLITSILYARSIREQLLADGWIGRIVDFF